MIRRPMSELKKLVQFEVRIEAFVCGRRFSEEIIMGWHVQLRFECPEVRLGDKFVARQRVTSLVRLIHTRELSMMMVMMYFGASV